MSTLIAVLVSVIVGYWLGRKRERLEWEDLVHPRVERGGGKNT